MNRASRAAFIILLVMVLACGTFEAGLDGPPTAPPDPASSAIAVLEAQRARLSTQAAALPVRSTDSIPPLQPTPQDILGGGTVASGPFTFDLRLFRDASLTQQPAPTSLYSDLPTIGAWAYWFYAGSGPFGPIQAWYGTAPQVQPLPQEAYASIQSGQSGGRAGGVLLPGGAFMSGTSNPGDRVQLVLKVTAQGAEFGGVLAFTLQQGPNGLEPADISVDVLSSLATPTLAP
ncbi:MAG: hypothetical protein ACM3MF_08450 [Anaerolineae bacterium]